MTKNGNENKFPPGRLTEHNDTDLFAQEGLTKKRNGNYFPLCVCCKSDLSILIDLDRIRQHCKDNKAGRSDKKRNWKFFSAVCSLQK